MKFFRLKLKRPVSPEEIAIPGSSDAVYLYKEKHSFRLVYRGDTLLHGLKSDFISVGKHMDPGSSAHIIFQQGLLAVRDMSKGPLELNAITGNGLKFCFELFFTLDPRLLKATCLTCKREGKLFGLFKGQRRLVENNVNYYKKLAYHCLKVNSECFEFLNHDVLDDDFYRSVIPMAMEAIDFVKAPTFADHLKASMVNENYICTLPRQLRVEVTESLRLRESGNSHRRLQPSYR